MLRLEESAIIANSLLDGRFKVRPAEARGEPFFFARMRVDDKVKYRDSWRKKLAIRTLRAGWLNADQPSGRVRLEA